MDGIGGKGDIGGPERPPMTNPEEMLHVLDRVHGEVDLVRRTLEATAHVVTFCRDRQIDFSLRPAAISVAYIRDRGQMGEAGNINAEKILQGLQAFQTDLYQNVFTNQQRVEFDTWAAGKVR